MNVPKTYKGAMTKTELDILIKTRCLTNATA